MLVVSVMCAPLPISYTLYLYTPMIRNTCVQCLSWVCNSTWYLFERSSPASVIIAPSSAPDNPSGGKGSQSLNQGNNKRKLFTNNGGYGESPSSRWTGYKTV